MVHRCIVDRSAASRGPLPRPERGAARARGRSRFSSPLIGGGGFGAGGRDGDARRGRGGRAGSERARSNRPLAIGGRRAAGGGRVSPRPRPELLFFLRARKHPSWPNFCYSNSRSSRRRALTAHAAVPMT
ncbi:hypothetical protein EVAR_49823_1 [Eumeta japonica]|uniref:Uncharacterized protein n=1 Tax=Eumeta variegata TaxID=151549 RepID=A0A4C1XRT1_EUMVA|nr:hypothetical protein EVAR_49823_1 [Eumeta japonica]